MKNANKTIEKGKLISNKIIIIEIFIFVEEGMLRMFYYEKKKILLQFYSEGKITANIDTVFKKK